MGKIHVFMLLILVVLVLCMIISGFLTSKEKQECRAFCYPQMYQIEANHCVCLEPTQAVPMSRLNEYK